MKTSCYTGYRQADGTLGPGAVRITIGAPRIRKSQYREYLALAPPRPMFEAGYTHADFAGRILAPLDAATVWQELHALVAPHEPVLLCFEKPEDILAGKTWCHRHMVAEWFAAELGEQVAERGHEANTAHFIKAARAGGLRETYASARRSDASAPPAGSAMAGAEAPREEAGKVRSGERLMDREDYVLPSSRWLTEPVSLEELQEQNERLYAALEALWQAQESQDSPALEAANNEVWLARKQVRAGWKRMSAIERALAVQRRMIPESIVRDV